MLGFCQLQGTETLTKSGLNDKDIYLSKKPKILSLANSSFLIQGCHRPSGPRPSPLHGLPPLSPSFPHSPKMAATVSGAKKGAQRQTGKSFLPCPPFKREETLPVALSTFPLTSHWPDCLTHSLGTGVRPHMAQTHQEPPPRVGLSCKPGVLRRGQTTSGV